MCEYDMCKLEVSAGVIETPSPTYQAEQQQKWGSVSFSTALKICTLWKPDKRQVVCHLNAV